jgi:FdrA protein
MTGQGAQRGAVHAVKAFADTYLDSVLQLAGTRAVQQIAGVQWGSAAMGTPANLDTLRQRGFGPDDLDGVTGGDLFLAVLADDDQAVASALEAGERAMFAVRERTRQGGQPPPRTLDEAVSRQPASTVAVISVPGEYAALEAHKAMTLGLDVLLFSDNVSVPDEIALKEHAARRGRLMMGPGAGTAMLNGTGLGFANVVRPGRVGVIAAAGTGAQEAMVLLHRWGLGVSGVVGLGGRDLSSAVGGRMAHLALEAMRRDPGTDAVLLVSKPAAREVVASVLAAAGDLPMVAAFVGLPPDGPLPAGHLVADTLEGGAAAVVRLLGLTAPDVTTSLGPGLDQVLARLPEERRAVRGLYSGGTLCYEALVLLGRSIGPVWSNTPLEQRHALPAPPGASVCLDLGEEEYTRGRPHPMIDPQARLEQIRRAGSEDDVAVVLIDVVLGHGSHPDPAGVLAPVCAELRHGGPQVVAYVLGTDLDPQGYAGQVQTLVDAGCIVTPTAARAALTAAAIAARDPLIARATL